jgi:hypothetical protein
MRLSYLVLALFIALCAVVYRLFIDSTWVTTWSANVGAGLLTSLVVVVLIDRVLERQRERELQRVRSVAVTQMRVPLMRHLSLLCDWYKAAALVAPSVPPKTIEDFFGDSYFQEVCHLDFSAPAPVLPQNDWLGRSGDHFEEFRRDLETLLDRYGSFLSAELIERVQEAAASSFVHMLITMSRPHVRQISESLNPGARYALFRGESVVDLLREHVSSFLLLLGCFNGNASAPIDVECLPLREDAQPRYGSARLS